MGNGVRRALTHYLQYRDDKGSNSREVFLSDESTPLTYNGLKLLIARLPRQADIPRLHLHLFRYSFAVKYHMAGGDLISLQRILGPSGRARVNPEFYLAECVRASGKAGWTDDDDCGHPTKIWGEFYARARLAITTRPDSLWQQITSPRIRAVMSMSEGGEVLYSERGLAAIDRPMLSIGGARDKRCIGETTYLLQCAGTADEALISFAGQDHLMIYNASA